MSKVAITIETDNDAFAEYPASEVGRILRQYANRVSDESVVEPTFLKDINGNTVGEVRVYESVESTAAKDQTNTV